MVNIRARLKDLQDSYGSYAELARSMGVNRSTVARWAAGTRKPSKRDRNRINDRWRRSSKKLRKEGAVVDISSYFRNLWYDGRVNSPLNFRNIPAWDFPNDAAVKVTWKVTAEIIDVGGFEVLDVVRNVTLEPKGNIAAAVQDSFEEWIIKAQNSFRQLLKVTKQAVLIRWLRSL